MGTLPEWWTGPYPEVASTKTATEYLDELGAALTRREEDGRWTLTTGDQDLITSENEGELDGFVLGFALAHLIVERHGPLGRRLRHPGEVSSAEAPPPPPPLPDDGDGDGDGDGDDDGDAVSEDDDE